MKTGMLSGILAASLRLTAVSLSCVGMVLCGARETLAQTPSTTTLTITSAGKPVTTVPSGEVVTLTAAVKARGFPVVQGQVNFCDATVSYCTDIRLIGVAQLTASGTAVVKFRPGVGNHSYIAVFAGAPSDVASKSGKTPLTVTHSGLYPTATTFTESSNRGIYTLSAEVTAAGAKPPTGTVSFVDTSNNDAVLGSAPVKTGSAGLNFTTLLTPDNTGSDWNDIAVGDFNGDGIPDLAVTAYYGGRVSVMLGNGDGTFQAPKASLAGGQPEQSHSFAVGDFNQDGVLDLAVADACSGSLEILLGNGDGTFTGPSPSLSPQCEAAVDDPVSIVTADFNGDGIPDLAYSNYGEGGSAQVLLGNGDGTFTFKSGFSYQWTSSLAEGDFNGDGIPDLVVTTSNPGTVVVLLGNGDGTFAPVSPKVTLSGSNWASAAADFNGDGKMDLAVANLFTGTVVVLKGNGDGTFAANETSIQVGGHPQVLAVGDFNGDGKADLAVEGDEYGNGTEIVLLGDGGGNFSRARPLMGGGGWGLAVGDFNGDGRTDLVPGDGADPLNVLLAEPETTTVTVDDVAVLPAATGVHQVEARYSGDSNYQDSTSSKITLASELGVPNVAVSASSKAVTYGTTVTLKAKVSGTGLPPTGAVSFYAGKQYLGGGALSNGLTAATTNQIPGGAQSITATYSGNSNYSQQTSPDLSITVNPATPAIRLASSASLTTFGASVTLTATLVGSGATPTGAVVFLDGKTQLGVARVSTSGVATFAIAKLALGPHSITASYGGDNNYSTATSTPVNVRVTGSAKPTVTLTLSASSTTYGTPVTLTAKVIGGAATPTGTATFFDGTVRLGTANLNSSGIASLATAKLTAGERSITAEYEGDDVYAPANSAEVMVTVVKATPTVTLKSSVNSAKEGAAVTFTANLSGSGAVPAADVTFLDGATKLATMTPSASGVATYSTGKLAVGTHSITAAYAGGDNYLPKTSAPVTVTITAQ
jgi:hypothetical protein